MEEDEASTQVRDARTEIYTDHAVPCWAVGFIEILPSSKYSFETNQLSMESLNIMHVISNCNLSNHDRSSIIIKENPLIILSILVGHACL